MCDVGLCHFDLLHSYISHHWLPARCRKVWHLPVNIDYFPNDQRVPGHSKRNCHQKCNKCFHAVLHPSLGELQSRSIITPLCISSHSSCKLSRENFSRASSCHVHHIDQDASLQSRNIMPVSMIFRFVSLTLSFLYCLIGRNGCI